MQRNLFKFMQSCTDLVPSNQGIQIQEAVNIILIIDSNVSSHSTIDFIVHLQAFKSICDLLITFSDQVGSTNVVLRKLHYISTASQQAVLNGFVQQYVFSAQEEGKSLSAPPTLRLLTRNRSPLSDSQDETRIEELHKKRNYLAAYCKLIVYNVIPVKAAADIFKHYLRVRFECLHSSYV